MKASLGNTVRLYLINKAKQSKNQQQKKKKTKQGLVRPLSKCYQAQAWVLSLDPRGVETTLAKLTSDPHVCAVTCALMYAYLCVHVHRNVNKPNVNKEKTIEQNKKTSKT